MRERGYHREALVIATAMVLAGIQGALADETAREHDLERLVRQDCGSCHGMTLKGGLGPALLPDRMATREPDVIAAIILDGIPGTPMPPWRGLISDADALWIANYLRKEAAP